jgi:glycosyltransferase involved in cell wall biosynthesis
MTSAREPMDGELPRIDAGAVAPLVTGDLSRLSRPAKLDLEYFTSDLVGLSANSVPDLNRRLDARCRRAPRVSVVVPTFNEAANLPHVFALIPEDVFEVIVVDGRSTDGTIEVAQALRPDVRIVRQNRRGKGNAMACGFAEVHGDVVVMLDADGSADPREIPQFVEVLVRGADFAKGTRFAKGGGSSDITATRRWGNRMLKLPPSPGSRRVRSGEGPQAVGRRFRDRDDHQHAHR